MVCHILIYRGIKYKMYPLTEGGSWIVVWGWSSASHDWVKGHKGEGKTFSKAWEEISGVKMWEPLLVPCCRVYRLYNFPCPAQLLPHGAAGVVSFSRAEGEKATLGTSKKWKCRVKFCSSSRIKCKTPNRLQRWVRRCWHGWLHSWPVANK